MTQPCGCRNCDNCPCPTSLPVVLREWTGDWDFTDDRDIRDMPGWSDALEHNKDSTAAGYLWRIVGFNWNPITFEPAPSGGWAPVGAYYEDATDFPIGGVTASNLDTLAIGPVRDWLLMGQFPVHTESAWGNSRGIINTGFGDYRTGYQDDLDYVTLHNWGVLSQLGHFGHKYAEFAGALDPVGNEWRWVGSGAGFSPLAPGGSAWATYQLQLGVIRCGCGNGLYVNWPAITITRPTSMLLLSEIEGGLTTERLEIPPSSYGGTISFGNDVATDLPAAVAWNGTAEDVVDAIENTSWAGHPVVDVSATGGPLPFNPIEVSYRFTGGFAGTRITPDFSRLLLPANGVRCRRMIEIEEDARAWSGNDATPLIEHSCAVDVGVDWNRDSYATAFDRMGWFENLQSLSARITHSDLTTERVLILSRESLRVNAAPEYEDADADAMLGRLSDWLDTGGKVLVLNGGVSALADDATACSTSVGVDNLAHYQARGWNYVLSALGSGCTMTGIGIPVPTGNACGAVWGGFLSSVYSVATHVDSDGGAAANYVRLTPASGSHDLLENAEEIEVTSFAASVNSQDFGSFPLEFIGQIVPGANATTLYEITAARTQRQNPDSKAVWLDDVLPGVVVESLPNGSWLIIVAVFNQFGGEAPIGDVFAQLPNAFLRDIVIKLPYS